MVKLVVSGSTTALPITARNIAFCDIKHPTESLELENPVPPKNLFFAWKSRASALANRKKNFMVQFAIYFAKNIADCGNFLPMEAIPLYCFTEAPEERFLGFCVPQGRSPKARIRGDFVEFCKKLIAFSLNNEFSPANLQGALRKLAARCANRLVMTLHFQVQIAICARNIHWRTA